MQHVLGHETLAPKFLHPPFPAFLWISFLAVCYPCLSSPGLVILATFCFPGWRRRRPNVSLALSLLLVEA